MKWINATNISFWLDGCIRVGDLSAGRAMTLANPAAEALSSKQCIL